MENTNTRGVQRLGKDQFPVAITPRKEKQSGWKTALEALVLAAAGMAGAYGLWKAYESGEKDMRERQGIEEPAREEKTISGLKNRTISHEGIEFVKNAEGYEPKVYGDSGKKPTIGYGHLIKRGEKFPAEITPAYAEQLLRNDLSDAERIVKAYVSAPLTQSHYDALVSFAYNVGEGNFGKSTLLSKLNKRDYQGAANEFNRWNKVHYKDKSGKKVSKVVPGLAVRREKERNMFLRS